MCKDCLNEKLRARKAALRAPTARAVFVTEAERITARRARQKAYYHANQAKLKAKSLNRYYENKQS